MKSFTKLHPLLVLIFTFFLVQISLRLIFVISFKNTAPEFELNQFLKAFYLGLKFDLRLSLLLVLPFALFQLIASPIRFPKTQKIVAAIYAIVLFFLLFGYYIDFGYYSYLQTRVNGSALKFLVTPFISLEMAWESYPLFWMGLSAIITSFLFYLFFSKKGFQSFLPLGFFLKKRTLKVRAFINTILVAFYILGLYGKFSHYPLRWSEAFFTNNTFISALALNPWHYFADTYKIKENPYNIKKVRNGYKIMSEFLGVTDVDSKNLNFKRNLRKTKQIINNPNIIIIMMESFAAHKTKSFGQPLNPTPNFDSLAKEGTLFTEFYTPSEGTARSMFTLVSSVPDLTQYRTSSRNPLIVEQNTAIKSFTNYEKYYFLGGSANWGVIRGVLQRNIPNLHMYEEGSYDAPKTDVWGINDFDLFKEASQVLKKRANKSKPFFGIIQTSGFHRPYTIPPGFPDFEIKTLSSNEIKNHGFVSNEEYNALRFSDYALGNFFEIIKNEDYFKNTLFVILGDHGLPELKAKHVPKGFQEFGLERFHVPLLFYGPAFIDKKRVDSMMTEPDVIPTLAGITGQDFQLSGIGRNILADDHKKNMGAFTYVYHTTPKIYHFMNNNFLVRGDTLNGVTGLYNYRGDTPSKNLKDIEPDRFLKMKELAEAYYETSLYLLYHNK